MARTALAVQQITRAGITPALTAANADGHSIANAGDVFLYARNGSGGSVTLTFETPATFKGEAVADPTVAIPAGEERMIGPFDIQAFNQGNGAVNVNFSAVTAVTVAALKL